MIIVETSVFTRQVTNLLTDEEYRELKTALVNRPSSGGVIPGTGGLCKIRWALSGKGKRGGVRVIYYWAVLQGHLLMLLMYPKSEREVLSTAQLRTLRQIVESEYP